MEQTKPQYYRDSCQLLLTLLASSLIEAECSKARQPLAKDQYHSQTSTGREALLEGNLYVEDGDLTQGSASSLFTHSISNPKGPNGAAVGKSKSQRNNERGTMPTPKKTPPFHSRGGVRTSKTQRLSNLDLRVHWHQNSGTQGKGDPGLGPNQAETDLQIQTEQNLRLGGRI